jgi:lysophospholipase L1-like esterase
VNPVSVTPNFGYLCRILISLLAGALTTGLLLLSSVKKMYVQELTARLHPSGVLAVSYSGNPSSDRILFLGDSRAANWVPLPAKRFRCVNAGQPGATTAQILLGTEQLLASERPALVVFQGGINDLKAIGVFPDSANQIESECVSNIHAIVTLCRNYQTRVVISLIFRPGHVTLGRRLVWSEAIPKAVEWVNSALIRDFSKKSEVEILDVNGILAAPPRSGVPDYLDTLHLRESAYRRIEPTLVKTIERLLALPNNPTSQER